MTTSRVDVLFTFAFETLEDVRRREFCRPPDQLLLQIVRDAREPAVVVADPWRSRAADIARGRYRSAAADATAGGRIVRHVRPMRQRLRDPTAISALRRQYERYGHLVRRMSGPAHAVITANPFIAAWSAGIMGGRCLYYARDDWAGHQNLRPWWHALDVAQQLIGRGEQQIFAVSRTLGDRLRPDGALTVVPNGVSSELWEQQRDWPFADIPKPDTYALYSGTVNSRLDIGLLDQIAQHPRIDRIVLAGFVESASLRNRLARMSKVVLLGDLDQHDLTSVTMNASVGVVPHVTSRQTTASSPLKVYEYLAGGLPIVTVDMASVGHLGERVHLCRDSSEWLPALDRALDQGRATETQRHEMIDMLSWRRRLQPIVESALSVENRSARER